MPPQTPDLDRYDRQFFDTLGLEPGSPQDRLDTYARCGSFISEIVEAGHVTETEVATHELTIQALVAGIRPSERCQGDASDHELVDDAARFVLSLAVHMPAPQQEDNVGAPELPPAHDSVVLPPAPPEIMPMDDGVSVSREHVDKLVLDAQRGEAVAVNALWKYLYPNVQRYCRARLGRDHAHTSPEDVAQEVMLAIWNVLPKYQFQGRPFMAFVHGIASHKIVDAHRTRTRNLSEPVADIPESISTEDGPAQQYDRRELAEELRDLLGKLTDIPRTVLICRVVDGMSAEETASLIGSTPGAVRVAQHRALAKLRGIYTSEAIEHIDDGGLEAAS